MAERADQEQRTGTTSEKPYSEKHLAVTVPARVGIQGQRRLTARTYQRLFEYTDRLDIRMGNKEDAYNTLRLWWRRYKPAVPRRVSVDWGAEVPIPQLNYPAQPRAQASSGTVAAVCFRTFRLLHKRKVKPSISRTIEQKMSRVDHMIVDQSDLCQGSGEAQVSNIRTGKKEDASNTPHSQIDWPLEVMVAGGLHVRGSETTRCRQPREARVKSRRLRVQVDEDGKSLSGMKRTEFRTFRLCTGFGERKVALTKIGGDRRGPTSVWADLREFDSICCRAGVQYGTKDFGTGYFTMMFILESLAAARQLVV
ncbi:hypothetical protein DFH06DRAFT_1439672 [Mycena polygramma]|nr:hypothetical protein DFH06DRAFT_1439672 [Mycena polygramma]